MSLSDFFKVSARLDSAIDRALSQKHIVGTVVLVARDNEIIYRRASGYADREAGTAMREDAIFRLASITKPMVTAAVMRLVEEGQLGLDTPVTQWLPDFRPTLPDGSMPEITVHHLLTHTSGLSYRLLEADGSDYRRLNVSDGMEQPGLSLKENLSRIAATKLTFRPGEGWRYSLALDVLGGVIEAAMGKTLPEVVREKVTAPLGIMDTDFRVTDHSRLVAPYAGRSTEPERMTDGATAALPGMNITFTPSWILNPLSYPSGGGGMAGTATDVLRFLDVIRAGGAPILEVETVESMVKDHVGPQAATQGPGWGFGYGWAVLTDPTPTGTPQAPGTLQWGGVYGHRWFIDRANDLSVVVLTNTAFEGVAGDFPVEIRNAVYG